MANGYPSMTALLAMLAMAGYQNRDKISEMLGGGGHAPSDPQRPAHGSVPRQEEDAGGLGGLLGGGASGGGLGGLLGGGASGGGLGGLLGGGAGAGGLGGLLGGLLGGGASAGGLVNGGLGELVDRFRQNGHGDVADSWVGPGANREVEPHDLERAIGPDVLDEIAAKTGLSRSELLSRLSKTLPSAVDQYTPNGKLPGAF